MKGWHAAVMGGMLLPELAVTAVTVVGAVASGSCCCCAGRVEGDAVGCMLVPAAGHGDISIGLGGASGPMRTALAAGVLADTWALATPAAAAAAAAAVGSCDCPVAAAPQAFAAPMLPTALVRVERVVPRACCFGAGAGLTSMASSISTSSSPSDSACCRAATLRAGTEVEGASALAAADRVDARMALTPLH